MRTPALLLALLLTALALPTWAAEPVKDQATWARETEISRVVNTNRLDVARARALIMQDKKSDATQILQRVMQSYQALNTKYPNQPGVLAALADVNAALDEVRGTNNRGKIVTEKFDKAEQLATEAINAAPTRGSLYIERANIRKQRGDKAGAIADYKKALEIEQQNEEWARQLNLLEPQYNQPLVPAPTEDKVAPEEKAPATNWYTR